MISMFNNNYVPMNRYPAGSYSPAKKIPAPAFKGINENIDNFFNNFYSEKIEILQQAVEEKINEEITGDEQIRINDYFEDLPTYLAEVNKLFTSIPETKGYVLILTINDEKDINDFKNLNKNVNNFRNMKIKIALIKGDPTHSQTKEDANKMNEDTVRKPSKMIWDYCVGVISKGLFGSKDIKYIQTYDVNVFKIPEEVQNKIHEVLKKIEEDKKNSNKSIIKKLGENITVGGDSLDKVSKNINLTNFNENIKALTDKYKFEPY